jgi:hypothetical protein
MKVISHKEFTCDSANETLVPPTDSFTSQSTVNKTDKTIDYNDSSIKLEKKIDRKKKKREEKKKETAKNSDNFLNSSKNRKPELDKSAIITIKLLNSPPLKSFTKS